jgi:hypothetical protein
MNKLTGTLLYVQLNKPVKAYVKAGEDKKPDEWKASVAIVDEDIVDQFEDYAKSIDAKVSVKKVKTAEFEAVYKTAPPEGAGKNIWVVTFRKSTELGKTGKPVPDLYRPKVFEKVKNTLVDVTNTKLPANGSIGSISIDAFTRNNGTSSLYLKNVLVTEMIEYVPEEGSASDYNPGDEFGDDDAPAPKVAEKAEAKPAAKPAAKAKAKPVADDDMDDDIPF